MRRGQHLRHLIRTLAGAALSAAVFLGPREAYAIRAPSDPRADIKRFGIDQFSRPRRRNPSVKSRTAFGPFNKAQGGRWKVRFDGRTGLPSALVEGASAPHFGTPQEAAAAFLAEQRDLLGIDPTTLTVERVTSALGRRHVLYSQTYRGLPVEFARVKVHLDARGAVTGVHSRFEPDLTLDITPTVTAAQAAAVVLRDAGSAPSSRAALVIFPEESTGEVRLAWKFTARDKSALWRYYIDAHTGAVLFRYNDLRFVAVCLTSGTISGQVYDVDPSSTPILQTRPFRHQNVYVVDASTFSQTYYDSMLSRDGFYCGTQYGAMFTQLQGPYVNVSNFRGPSLHYDNGGGQWYTANTPLSSPHPYPDNATLVSQVHVLDPSSRTVVKALPIFTSFRVGTVSEGNGSEASAVDDDDELAVLDPLGNPVGAFFGNRGAFNGTAVAGDSYQLRLKSNAQSRGESGYDVSLSSYLVLPSPHTPGVSNDLTWSPSMALEGRRSEISLFYHINLMHDFFVSGMPAGGPYGPGYPSGTPGVDSTLAADINSHPVNAIALVGPTISDPFYNPDQDNLNFGDTDITGNSRPDVLADDATVTHHEYTHYMVEKIWSIQNFGQAGAISEGLADYFSATSLNDSSIGAYYNGGPALRELDCLDPGTAEYNKCRLLCSGSSCQATSPAGYVNTAWAGEIHDDSRFFSQALWDIRADQITRLGPSAGPACADGLVFQSLLFFPESFEEFLDALSRVDSQGLVAACGGANMTYGSSIFRRFTQHGLSLGSNEAHTGFESALDVSTYTLVTGAISSAGHTDFYTFGAGPGSISIIMTLPVHAQPPDGYYNGYGLTLYDLHHDVVAMVPSSFIYCDESDCKSDAQTVVLNYDNPTAGQMFLQVGGGFDSGVNSMLPYALTFNYPRSGALVGSVVQASFDHDVIDFSVAVTTWTQTQDYSFAYAQLRDQAKNVIPNSMSNGTVSFLNVAPGSVVNALGMITGQVRISTGSCLASGGRLWSFSQCFPSVGTIYLEVFGSNVSSQTVNPPRQPISLGLSNPINLATLGAAFHAYNNIFNPARGEKATVKYEIQSAGHVTLKLYTLSGALVGTLFDGDVPAGKGSVDWFGNNSAGNRVASGVYLVHMAGPGVDKTQKIVVVK